MRYHIDLSWTRRTESFSYEEFDRTHFVKFAGGIVVKASSAPEFFGNADHANPEELYLAALSSCHMLTFLAIAAKSRIIVEDYRDHAEAILEKTEQGFWVKEIILNPMVTFYDEPKPSLEKLRSLHEKAHKNCFISNSIKTDVKIEPRLSE